jgi:LPXTG-site transpeptidase (sortase) family protein
MRKIRLNKYRIIEIILGLIILISMAFIISPFLPGVVYNVEHLTIKRNINQANEIRDEKIPDGRRLVIPLIDVDSQIVEGDEVGVLDSQEGVWLQAGQVGTTSVVIAGHRFKYLPPNRTTLYNLDKLKVDDLIAIYWDGQKYIYTVKSQYEVDKDDISILNPTDDNALIIYTCVDDSFQKRLVVKALPTKN